MNMKFRPFGTTGWNASALGFGCMRLPLLGETQKVDETMAIRMIRHAIDSGVNYIDTAWPYHGQTSETVVGKALRDGYRSRVKLATKLPVWLVKEPSDFDRIFDAQLAKLQTDRIDLYLLHSLGQGSWDKVRAQGVLEWATRQKERGRIGWIGFSFHDEYPAFKNIVDGWDGWTFCQIQYNYMNTETQAGTKGFEYAAGKGLAVVIMEPLLGGGLSNPPPAIQKVWDSAENRRTPSDWALQWLWDKPQTAVVLSGMTAMSQLEENLASAERSGVGLLTPAEMDLYGRARVVYEHARPIPCTQCNYCMPCPSGVNIPRNLELYNNRVSYDALAQARGHWSFFKPSERATACTACLECESKCPQSIVVHEWMSCISKEMAG
jgi:predicted aldo/keto reductase-like oxidoreductase